MIEGITYPKLFNFIQHGQRKTHKNSENKQKFNKLTHAIDFSTMSKVDTYGIQNREGGQHTAI